MEAELETKQGSAPEINQETEMQVMEPSQKPSLLKRLRNHRGFSLVEMAIVMVIIGIIIAAIVKGQDLILNAEAKKVISAVSTWRNLNLAFLDRNGRYPGDENRDGIIGNNVSSEQGINSTATGEIGSTMMNLPENPIQVGSTRFWVYVGNTTIASGAARNAILICGSVDCVTAFSPDQREIIKAMDTAFDGIADSGMGQFRAASPAVLAAAPAALANNSMAATFDAVNVVSVPNTTAGTTAAWSTADKAAIWLFDKPY
jgi:prepilin-type N-terminal cleavage/methylation domain-containing protein